MDRTVSTSLLPSAARLLRTPVALLLAACGVADAADMKIRDVRLVGGLVGESSDGIDVETRLNTGQVATHQFASQDDAKLGIAPREGIEMYESFGRLGRAGGLVLGLGFVYSEQETKGDSHSAPWAAATSQWLSGVRTKTTAFDVHFGWAYGITKRLSFEVMPFAGAGSFQVQDRVLYLGTTPRTDKSRGSGLYREAGVRVGLGYAFANGFFVGGDAGYLFAHGHANIGYVDGTSTYEIDHSCAIANLSIGCRF